MKYETLTLPEYPIEATIPAGISDMTDRSAWPEYKGLVYSPMENYFWLQVSHQMGESMKPFISENEYVFCSVKEIAKSGDIVAAKWGNKNAALKIYNVTDKNEVILSSYNPTIPFIQLKRSEVKVYKVKLIEKK